MGFLNPILAGTALIRTAIKSPNYVASVSGWSINKVGTSEFTNATIRGILDVISTLNTSEIKIYVSPNNNTAVIEITPPASSDATVTFLPATIIGNTPNTDQADLILTSPTTHKSGTDYAVSLINLLSGGINPATEPSLVQIQANGIELTADLSSQAVTVDGGLIVANAYHETGNSPQGPIIGTTLTDITGLDSIAIGPNQTYIYELHVAYNGSAAGDAKFAWSTSGSILIDRSIIAPALATATNVDTTVELIRRAFNTAQAVGGPAGVANAFTGYHEFGRIKNQDLVNTQFMTLQAAENAASTGVTIQANSWFYMQRVA